MSLQGKTAFITGIAHGQGRATALELAREGVNVCGLDVGTPLSYPGYAMGTPAELTSLEEEVAACGVGCATFVADVRDRRAVQACVERSVAQFGRVDILFNNAGICAYGLSHELSEDEWDAMLDINLKGPWLVGRAVIPIMIRQRSGVIINNVSVAGARGVARLSHYAASKWGLTGLTKSWALELAPYGIRVNAIGPGLIESPMTHAYFGGPEGVEQMAQNAPLGRSGQPLDVANTALFLASDESSFYTGSILHPDGGSLTQETQ